MYMNTIAALQILHVMLVPTKLYDLHYINYNYNYGKQ